MESRENREERREKRAMEKGVVRWLVDISNWNPTNQQFSFLLSLLPLQEHSSITSFIKLEDKKRALVSRLLQYALVHRVLGIPFHQIFINRTPGGKPYFHAQQFPNFNFNTSHHGDYVGIASEPLYIVGLDIVSTVSSNHETPIEFVSNFSSYFTAFEWDYIINSASSQDQVLANFYRYWCLKETYIKAIGAGLGYKLDRLEFHHTDWTNISLYIDGKLSTEWTFSLSQLPKGHWVCTGKGHPRNDVKNYRKTLHLTEFEDVENPSTLQLTTSFVLRNVEQLLPVSSGVAYGIFTDNQVNDN